MSAKHRLYLSAKNIMCGWNIKGSKVNENYLQIECIAAPLGMIGNYSRNKILKYNKIVRYRTEVSMSGGMT